jgi:signal transduction histidine kinase
MMPGTKGTDLIESIHELDPEMVCIIITGFATVELAVESIKLGAYDFLTKPFSVDTLILAVNQGIERRRLALEARKLEAAEAEARQLAEEKRRLEELDHAKRQFIRLVTHDLQAPVSAIENYLKLIQQGYISPEEQPEIIKKCLARTQEELDLLADLLELGHLEVVESFRKSEVHFSEVLHSVLESFQERIEQKKLQVEIKTDEAIPVVIAAREQIKSLWQNLISNAIKYTPDNGQVTVRLYLDDAYLVGEVSDTGIGIRPQDQEQIFSEFFRAQNARALNVPGTGLGLTIVKRIVDSLGGKITFDSGLKQGTTFAFKIPLPE